MFKPFPAGYERTCKNCGYTWQLPRSQAKFRGRFPGVQLWSSRRLETFVESQAEFGDIFTHCAKCGSARFDQKPLRTYSPPV